MPGRRLAPTLTSVFAVIALVACTSGGASTSSSAASSAASPLTWTGAGPAPRSRLYLASNRVIYLGTDADQIQLVALDAKSGAVEWSRLATVPALPAEQRPALVVDGDHVVALDGGGALISVDAATGEVSWRASLSGPATSNPFDCADAVCVVASAPSGPTVQRFDLAAGTLERNGPVVGSTIVATAGDEVLSVRGDVLLLARDEGVEEVWRLAIASSLGVAPDPSMRWRGWVGRNGTWIVWTGPADASQPGVAAGLTVTGAVLWRATGARPCPRIDDDTARDGHEDFPVVLCFGSPATVMTGVDPLTGAGMWQLDDPALEGPNPAVVVRTSVRSWLLHTATDDIEVDVDEGPRRPGEDVTGGWCGEPDPFPCALDGSAYPTPDVVPAFAGLTAEGFGIWVQDGTVRALKPA